MTQVAGRQAATMSPRIGSLCSGYGGLDMAVEAVTGATTAWVSDIDKGACKILAHRYPDVPNLGDFTKTDWATVEPVDILCAGFPCQPVSNAGKQLGDLDERWLWDDVARAVSTLRPGLVVLENVRGLLTAGSGRLFGSVLGTLAQLGYDTQWHGLRAAEVGAPHGRFRIFIVAENTGGMGRNVGRVAASLQSTERWPRTRPAGPSGMGADWSAVPTLLPTPAVNDMGAGKTVEAWDEWTAKMQAAHGNGNGHGKSLAIEAQRLLATPTVSVATGGPPQDSNGKRDLRLDIRESWGQYAAAIAHWEHALGRPAPAPTTTSTKGNPQLAPAFVEWMMGLPAGWVTEVPELTRNEQLKALGNGVVPAQAEAALRIMLQDCGAVMPGPAGYAPITWTYCTRLPGHDGNHSWVVAA